MATFMVTHRHRSEECAVAFAAWRGFDSPLRHGATHASCSESGAGEHVMWWAVDASSERDAMAQLPAWVAERTEVSRVTEVPIP